MRALLLAFALLTSATAFADCIPIEKAPDKIGADLCVKATVLNVAQSRSGTWFLDFCPDYRTCPFTVVVFPSNLRDVGDIRQLKGKTIEIHGHIKEYKGRAEIVLRDKRQLKGDFGGIPPMPRGYDAERHGSAPARAYTPNSKSSNKSTAASHPSGEPPPGSYGDDRD